MTSTVPSTGPQRGNAGRRDLARARLIAATCAILIVAACSSDSSAVANRWQTVTDTIGDTIVIRTPGASDLRAPARLVRELSIGELEGPDEYQFANVASILPAPHGGVYIWDETTTQLRQYDSAGTYLRDVGRKGGGPGEYQYLNGLGVLPDGRILTWDARLQRINAYDTAGTMISSWRANSRLLMDNGLTVDTAGNVYLFDLLDPPDPGNPDGERRSGYIRLAAGDPDSRDTLVLPYVGPEPPTLTATGMSGKSRVSSLSAVPFAPAPFGFMGPAGYFVTAMGDRYAVTLHRPEGPLRIERDLAPTPVSPEERKDAEDRMVATMRQIDAAWKWTGPRIPDVKPAIRTLEVGADGRIWIGRSMPGERIPEHEIVEPRTGEPRSVPPRRWREPVAYDVFSLDGHYLGMVPVPPRTTLLYRRGDIAWGVVRDSLDVPFVTRFRIEWPPR